jgi:prefoldin subunit 5
MASYPAQSQYAYNMPYNQEELAVANECVALHRKMYKMQHRIMKLARKHELDLQNTKVLIKAAKKRLAKLERLQDAAFQQDIDTLQAEILQLEDEQRSIDEEFVKLHSIAGREGWLSPRKLGQIHQEFAKVSGTSSSAA